MHVCCTALIDLFFCSVLPLSVINWSLTLPVSEAIVSKHMTITNASHYYNFKRSETACPDPETNIGTRRSLVLLSTREEIRTGNLSTLCLLQWCQVPASNPSAWQILRFTGWKVILGLLGSFTAKKLSVTACKMHIEADKSLFYTFSAFFILETVFTYKIKFYVWRIYYLRAF